MDFCLEYQWPPDGSERSILVPLQEAMRFLGDRKLVSKHPELEARNFVPDEATFLKKLGLTLSCQQSVRLESLLSVMEKHYPDKYEAYMSKLHNKALDICGVGAKVPMGTDTMRKLIESKRTVAHRSIRKAARYNSELGVQRRLERSMYFDTQTQLVHYPKTRRQNPRRRAPLGNFPVAVLPGQYQDYCTRYTSEQLKCLPLKTVIVHPPSPPMESVIPPSFLNSKASSSAGPYPSHSLTRDTSAGPLNSAAATHSPASAMALRRSTSLRSQLRQTLQSKPSESVSHERPTIKHDKICGLCLRGPERNRKGVPEALINCSTCQNSGHPSCLELSVETVRILRSYSWQCMECKNCMLCSDPGDEEKMMFCDDCDRGYHTFCVGLNDIPTGEWMCKRCSACNSCGTHSTDFSAGNPCTHHFTLPRDGSEPKFVQTLCKPCSSLFHEGHFCPVCLAVYRNDETDLPMVCCDFCDRWIHIECDNISEALYSTLAKEKSKYRCVLCRGGEQERMDAFHKKYRSGTLSRLRK